MSISCSKSSDISTPTTNDTKSILNHYFPVKSHLQVFDVIESSEHDPQGMIAALLLTYCKIHRQPWPKRSILHQESNVVALKLYFKSCELSKTFGKFPSWVLRGPLDDDYIITPTSHEGLMSDEELYHRGLLRQAMRQDRAMRRGGRGGVMSSSRLSKRAVSKSSDENRVEPTAEDLVNMREELDEFVLPDSDEEEPSETDHGDEILASILADMPSTLDGVSVSCYFKGKYSVLFGIDIEAESTKASEENARRPLFHELSAVSKAVKSGKQAQYRDRCQEKKEILREKEDDAKIERERVGKKRRLMKGNAGVVYH